MTMNWKALVAGGAVAGLGIGGFVLPSNASQPGPVEGIDLASTANEKLVSAPVPAITPIQLSADSRLASVPATEQPRRILANPEAGASASVQSAPSPISPVSEPSPNTPPTADTPNTPNTPESPVSAQTPNTPNTPQTPVSVQSVASAA
jgi:hypothetical protein